MTSFFDTRFVLNTGKGGVGKTTISAAMAVAYARRGKRVLLMELNVKDRLGPLFDTDAVGPDIVEIAPNIHAVNTTPADAMREYALMVIKVKAIYRAVFENRVVERFLRVVPGLPELVMLGKAYYHETERAESGRPVWDVVIVDAPATGHGMFLLQIPQVITRAIESGRMAEESGRILDLLQDPKRTRLNVVTLAEEIPVNETIELVESLKEAFDLPFGHVIANQILPHTFTPREAELVHELIALHRAESTSEPGEGEPGDDLGQLLAAAAFRDERSDLQARYLDELRERVGLPLIEVPFYPDPDFDRSVLERIAAHITADVTQGAR